MRRQKPEQTCSESQYTFLSCISCCPFYPVSSANLVVKRTVKIVRVFMNSLSIVVDDKDKFHDIYQNLSLLGTPEHEGLNIIQVNSGKYCYPITCKRSWYDITETDSKVMDFTLTFFEKNLGMLAEESYPHEMLINLEPLLKHADKKKRLHNLRQKLYNLHLIKATEQERSLIIQESAQRAIDLENKAKQRAEDLEQRAIDLENKAKQRAEELERRAIDLENKAKQRVEGLERQFEFLKNEIVNLEDTIIICQNTSLSLHLKKLCKVQFFHSHNQHNNMEKTSLSLEEKKHYKYKFEFLDFHSTTVMTLAEWIDDPNIIHNIQDFNAIYELYRLADFVNDAAFRKDCLKVIEKVFTEENKFLTLAMAEYSSGDDLITFCCSHVINNFKHLENHPKFLEIQPEYFLRIIQDQSLLIDNAEELFYAILAWAEVKAAQADTTPMNVLYNAIEGYSLMDCMPLGNISKDFFSEKVLPLNILSKEDTFRWLQFHIKGKTQPLKNFYMLKCNQIDDHKAHITWNIPLEVFLNISNWENHATMKEFRFNDNTWNVCLGKSNNVMRIALQVLNITRDFELFLDIGYIQLYTGTKNLSELTVFTNNGFFKDPDQFFKGVDINLTRLDALDLKQGYVSLKILLFLKDTTPPTN
jgi:BTB/Kelch-like protein